MFSLAAATTATVIGVTSATPIPSVTSTPSVTPITPATTVTATVTPDSTPQSSDLGMKIGIGVGVPVGVLLIAGLVIFVFCRKRKTRESFQEGQNPVFSSAEVYGNEYKPAPIMDGARDTPYTTAFYSELDGAHGTSHRQELAG